MKKAFKVTIISIAFVASIGGNNLANAQEGCADRVGVSEALKAAATAKKEGLAVGDSIEKMALDAIARGEDFITTAFQDYTSSGGLAPGASSINLVAIYYPKKWDPAALGITADEARQMLIAADIDATQRYNNAATQGAGINFNNFYFDATYNKDNVGVLNNSTFIIANARATCVLPADCECFTCAGGPGDDPNGDSE